MARPRNQLATNKLRITITPQLVAELELLVETGYFGANVNDAVHRLISEGVRAAYAQGREVYAGRQAYAELVQSRGGSIKGK